MHDLPSVEYSRRRDIFDTYYAFSGIAAFVAVTLHFYAVEKEASVSVILTSEVLITYLGAYVFSAILFIELPILQVF